MTAPAGPSVASRIADLDPDRRARLLQRLRATRGPAERSSDWFVRPRGVDRGRRLFCFPYAGGGASVYRGWAPDLDDVEMCSVQLPGRESRVTEPAHRRLEDLLAELEAAILPLLDRPFVFFGHSMGALVAFELTRRLRRHHRALPDHLLLAAFRAPHLPNPNIRIHHLPDEVLKTVLRTEGTPAGVLDNAELMSVLLPTLRADFELCDTYTFDAEAPLPMPLSVFGGRSDVRVGQSDLEQWRAQAGAGFDLRMFPGSHFFLHTAQPQLVAAVRSSITVASTGRDPVR